MKNMSPGAIGLVVVGIAVAIFVNQTLLDFDGVTGIFVAAITGAIGGLIGGALGSALFPKKENEND